MPVQDVRKHRDLHLERKHVYNVYDQIAPKFSEISQKAWPNVRRFLKDLPPGSVVADIGCGSGRYLHINSKVSKIGVDICTPLVEGARNKGHEVLVADNLTLPFRDGAFDAVISIGVIHHFSSQSRRLQAVKEMCRLLRPGGQIMIYVWAFEQKHRKFKAQDVLIPWHGNQSNKRSGSLDLSSNASSDSESSIDTEDSRKSIQNLNRTLSDPGTEHDETQLQAYLRTVTQGSQFTQKHRCNTLPSSLEGLSGEESHDETMPSVLAAECRKFEASLKAMSSRKSSKMKKPKLEMPLCESEDVDVSDFAVREFPMSSCPNYRKEITSEDSEEVFLSNESPDTGVICMKDKASDFHGHQTSTKLSRPNGAQLKHSMSDISPSKLQSLKRFDHMSTDSLKTRTQVIGMSRQHSHSLPTVNLTEPVQVSYPPASVPSSPAIRNEFFKNSTELSRFYHVFKDGELSKLISKQVPNVRIVSSTYDHANWCIVAEKCLTS
uniref:Methyltransferase type 11 domain-containing protein n=1 Tax=Magallana gigas TaxID=29159 RepID=K1QTK1_MAGGI